MTLAINIINPGVLKLLVDLEQLNLISLTPETRENITFGSADLDNECPLCAAYGNKPNAESLAAIQEARDIMSGKKKTKTYYSLEELNRELDAEYEAEYGEPRC